MLTTARGVRVAVATVMAAALTTTGALVAAAAPAAGAPRQVCVLLPALCPPTTARPPATTATTKAPASSVPPKTSAPTTKAATKAAATTATTATTVASPSGRTGQPTLGALGVGVAGLDPSLSQPVPAAVAPAAPELAGTGNSAPDAQAATSAPPDGISRAAAFAGTAGSGLPNRHTALRILLSLVTLVIAGLAAAQLPASRRRQRADAAGDNRQLV